ncbi:hypothetical protein ACFQL1_13595 [Halomicroarcula sp. GCM10025709]
MFEVDPDVVDAQIAVELHERRAVRVVEDTERDAAVVESRPESVRRC